MRYNFPTRRRKARPAELEIGVINRDGTPKRRMVPATDYPAVVFLPHFGRAGFFVGNNPNIDTLYWKGKAHPTVNVDEHMALYGFDGVYEAKFMPHELGQTIIKICYAYAIAELGIDSFEPVCLPQILGKDNNISYIFGQKGETQPEAGDTIIWKITLAYIVSRSMPPVLTAQCVFLEKMGMPIYEVVLGFIRNFDQFAVMKDKISNYSLVNQF
ncbi:hypothetical protein [Methylobacterium aerolatum]|uniref:Uncharacterized protein n=1 Tax=Methylobacterium aerolatum TaxID=418708 RepID=A0ABU0HZS6_9HYPH|nr:hypothetical protein [Methylobacterium aerolatum]MDQ0446981.1 hypothetical protein [Methylobacterium aerolatum]